MEMVYRSVRNVPLQLVVIAILLCGFFACGGGSNEVAESLTVDSSSQNSNHSSEAFIIDRFEGGFNPLWNASLINEPVYSSEGVGTTSAPSSESIAEKVFQDFGGQSGVLHYLIPSGTDELTPVQVGISGESGFEALTGQKQLDEIYVEWSEYFPSSHDFANGGQKLVRGIYYKEEDPIGGPLFNFSILLDNQLMQLEISFPRESGNSYIEVFQNTSFGIPLDQWVDFTVWVKLNTPGLEDGIGVVTMNGQTIIDLPRFNVRGSSSKGFNHFWVGGNHTNQGLTTQESHRYINDVAVFFTNPNQ